MKRKSTFCVLTVMVLAGLLVGGCAGSKPNRPDTIVQPASNDQSSPSHGDGQKEPGPTSPGNDGRVVSPTSVVQEVQRPEEINPVTHEVDFDVIYFNFDSSELTRDARDAIMKNYARIKKDKITHYILEGHCEEIGDDSYNFALGDSRAQAVKRYLVTIGIPAERLATVSF